jgi:large subunit ribosomal protein L6e
MSAGAQKKRYVPLWSPVVAFLPRDARALACGCGATRCAMPLSAIVCFAVVPARGHRAALARRRNVLRRDALRHDAVRFDSIPFDSFWICTPESSASGGSLTLPHRRLHFAHAQVQSVVQTITKPIGGGNNGAERVVTVRKGSKWYPADDVKVPVPSRKHVHKPTKLRPSIKPGCVLILLTGAYAGMRVVFLKQLPSGLLLVTGPFCVNGIPLRRVDQAYVISCSATVDVSAVDTSKYDDAYFKRTPKAAPGEGDFLNTNDAAGSGKVLTDEKKADQKAVDAALLPAIEKVADMKDYLSSKFTLTKGQYPHLMKF